MKNPYLKAILEIARSSAQLEHDLLPLIDIENETVRWDKINYGVLSGGVKTAFSWAYILWTDEQNKSWRDPFENFGNMDLSVQKAILRAMTFSYEISSLDAPKMSACPLRSSQRKSAC